MEEVRLDYSRYRFDRAEGCLMTAKISFEQHDDLLTSLNRSYYAIFNAIRAVTLLDSFDSKKHRGVISYFNQNYVKTKIFPPDTYKLIDSAFKLRGYADYKDMYLASRKETQEQISNAEYILSFIKPYLVKRWKEIEQKEELKMNAIFTRVSTRQFEPRKVESKYIIKILRAAMAAPSACNQQPWEFWVTDDPEIIARLSQVSPYAAPVKNAPVVIVPCYRTDTLIAAPMVEIDMAMSTQNILLEAEELGLGAVMIGIAPIEERMKSVKEILKLPENIRAFTIVPIGYPVNKTQQEDRYEPSKVHTL